eukprot:gnl/MRDRNA2_/MRDRNA2_98985_c0_seq1.p1 gnl/MRDRNA2_/MRDRNA2_98985_c0~~gnl/MRDRNA2_/MRDRNA2_98985_c0_seq1.p1  ORF type:complete len:414 (+),score=57.26 gnl/MRDRNA2_/MRDRNA2_98985_c0_seq1:95-1336(+)
MRVSRLGVAAFFLSSVHVHSKGGCFDPTMLVTMADGSRKALMEVQLGDNIKSWNFEMDSPTNSTVVDIPRFHRDSLMELHLETGEIIYATDDHPFWSHAKKGIVSRDPSSTFSQYGIHADLLDDEEVFLHENRKPVAGRVSVSRRTASVIMDGVDIPDNIEVMTLSLNGSHWFYVQGILVHNKGGDAGEDEVEDKGCGGPKPGCRGGRPGGVVLGTHGYRRRRGHILTECFVIDTSHHQCHDDDHWDEEACKKASRVEYHENQACYDCQDDECIQSLCGGKFADPECHPGVGCTCGGWKPKHAEDFSVPDECKATGGKCPNGTARRLHDEHDSEPLWKTCCPCYKKMYDNVKCDEEPYEPSIFPVVVACLGGAGFFIGVAYLCVKKICEWRNSKNEIEEFSDLQNAPSTTESK